MGRRIFITISSTLQLDLYTAIRACSHVLLQKYITLFLSFAYLKEQG